MENYADQTPIHIQHTQHIYIEIYLRKLNTYTNNATEFTQIIINFFIKKTKASLKNVKKKKK